MQSYYPKAVAFVDETANFVKGKNKKLLSRVRGQTLATEPIICLFFTFLLLLPPQTTSKQNYPVPCLLGQLDALADRPGFHSQ
jgi:hypothetical protein